jgi:hypothetical protein
MVFEICLVETCVVVAHPNLPIDLRDDHRIGQSLRVVDLLYEAGAKQLLNFFTDEVLPLNALLLGPLLDRSSIGVDLQMVLNHLPRDVFPTTMVVDFFPEVCRHVAHHWCAMLC